MLAALTLSTVIIWKVLNNIIDNDNANDDEQVEAKQMEHSVVDGRFHLDRFLQFGWMVEELKEHL